MIMELPAFAKKDEAEKIPKTRSISFLGFTHLQSIGNAGLIVFGEKIWIE